MDLSLAHSGPTSLEVFDAEGCLVRTLLRESLAPGRYQRVWDGTLQSGATSPAGVYFLKLDGPGIRLERKVVRGR